MPDGKWEKMNAGDSKIWETSWKDGIKNPKEGKSKKRENGITTETFTQTYTYPTFTPVGFGYEIEHKCIRCDKRHDHYVYLSQDMGGQQRPDLVYTPLHVPDKHWGQGSGRLYSAVKVTGERVRRIVKTTSRGKKIIKKEVAWESKTLDHTEERDYVVLEPFSCVVDCVTQVQETAMSAGGEDAEEILLSMLAQDPGISHAVTHFSDSADVMAAVKGSLAKFSNPAMKVERRFHELSVIVTAEDKAKKPVELGTIRLKQSGSSVDVTGWQEARTSRRKETK